MISGKRLAGLAVAVIGSAVAAAAIYGRIVDRHFERGSQDARAVVLSVKVRTFKEGFRRVGRHHYVRTNRSRTQRTFEYAYEVAGERYTGRLVTSAPLPRPPRTGDSIRIRYAVDKPSLSRVRTDRLFR